MATSDGASARHSSVPLFTPILPPRINSTSYEALVEWKRERRDYEAKLQAQCRVTGEDYNAMVESVAHAFDPELLDVFCDLKLNMASADVTEGMLIEEIEHIISNVKNNTLPDIKVLFKRELKMDMDESDVEARVLDYFKTFYKIMLNYGLSECFGGTEGSREKCKRLVSSLLPVSLKKEVKQCVRFTHKEAPTDARQLFRLILEKAPEHERQYHRLKQQKKDQPARDKGGSKPAESVKQKRWNDKKFPSPNTFSTPSVSRKPAVGLATPKATTGSKPNSSLLPPGPCPKCSQMHWIRECTQATEAEKSQLVKQLREAKKSKKAGLKRLGEMLPVSDRQVTLNGVLTVPYCPDSGSDYTVVGRSHWELLRACDPNVEAERLDVPVRTQTFGATPVAAEFKPSLHVMIHTAAGPVEPMQAVEVLIVDVDDDEFIVGNDLLTTLDIDVDRQLEQLVNYGDDETSGDTIELEADEMPVDPSGSVSSDSDIFAAVERLIDRAVENGFPLDHVEQLRTIAHAYDVWRLELERAYPPANVPPLKVRLWDGARPTKCKPRKYPPQIRKFLHELNARLVSLGMVYENSDIHWASPVLPVKKSAD